MDLKQQERLAWDTPRLVTIRVTHAENGFFAELEVMRNGGNDQIKSIVSLNILALRRDLMERLEKLFGEV